MSNSKLKTEVLSVISVLLKVMASVAVVPGGTGVKQAGFEANAADGSTISIVKAARHIRSIPLTPMPDQPVMTPAPTPNETVARTIPADYACVKTVILAAGPQLVPLHAT